MDLQPLWAHTKTPAMDERGKLVRHSGPNWLRSFDEQLAEAAGLPIGDLLIEGRDGTGPKTEVPWFRFASKLRSPSATMSWYCVYLFDTTGRYAYLSLGHRSTDWTGGSRQIGSVLDRVVLEPNDVEVGLVAGDELVVGECLEALRL